MPRDGGWDTRGKAGLRAAGPIDRWFIVVFAVSTTRAEQPHLTLRVLTLPCIFHICRMRSRGRGASRDKRCSDAPISSSVAARTSAFGSAISNHSSCTREPIAVMLPEPSRTRRSERATVRPTRRSWS